MGILAFYARNADECRRTTARWRFFAASRLIFRVTPTPRHCRAILPDGRYHCRHHAVLCRCRALIFARKLRYGRLRRRCRQRRRLRRCRLTPLIHYASQYCHCRRRSRETLVSTPPPVLGAAIITIKFRLSILYAGFASQLSRRRVARYATAISMGYRYAIR